MVMQIKKARAAAASICLIGPDSGHAVAASVYIRAPAFSAEPFAP